MTTSMRGTPSFTAPPTQNTAPVHEFRCLFTHDAHKKAKKWHDGSVRFHTFNRRVMIYDDGKNYIGDNHYGQDEFGEGVELRTDRNVLVEVGERLGETQTDVSSILDRRKDDSSPQPARNIRLVAAASQHESKSISQILGTQTRVGRARVLPSPFQQRQALAPTQPAETPMPPPKRQRLDISQQENRPIPPPRIETLVPKVAKQVKPKLSKPRPVPQEDPIVIFQDVLDLSSDEEIARSARKQPPKPKKAVTRKTATAPKECSTPRVEAPSTEEATLRVFRDQVEPPKQHVRASGATSIKPPFKRQQQHPSEPSNRTRVSQPSTSSRSGTTQLRLLSPKPRRKLMYKALLPSSKQQSGVVGAPSHGESLIADSDPSTSDRSNRADVSERANATLERKSTSPRAPVTEVSDVPSSPLFIPEERHQHSPSPGPLLSQDSLEESLLARPHSPRDEAGPQKESPQESPMTSPVVSDLEQHAPETTHPRNAFPASQKQMLPPPLPLPAPLQTVNTPVRQARPFRRVRSESDAFQEAEDDLPDFDGFSVPPPSFLAKANVSPARVFRSPQKTPAKLRRTASDSAIMGDGDERVVGYNVEPILEDFGETGPWTTAEAYLLFEWWPPGRPKPDYGAPAYTELTAPQCGPARVAITTARDMLRDEINVL